MKIETRKEIKEVVTNVYVADDGTEFDGKYDCEVYEYELKTKRLNEQIAKLELKKLNDIPPLDTKARYIQDNHNFRWFKVNDKKDVDLIGAMYGDGVVEPKQYPDVICVEIDEDTNYYEAWSLYLSGMKQETIEFWEHFGLKVNFEEVKNND